MDERRASCVDAQSEAERERASGEKRCLARRHDAARSHRHEARHGASTEHLLHAFVSLYTCATHSSCAPTMECAFSSKRAGRTASRMLHLLSLSLLLVLRLVRSVRAVPLLASFVHPLSPLFRALTSDRVRGAVAGCRPCITRDQPTNTATPR